MRVATMKIDGPVIRQKIDGQRALFAGPTLQRRYHQGCGDGVRARHCNPCRMPGAGSGNASSDRRRLQLHRFGVREDERAFGSHLDPARPAKEAYGF